ncbi:PREDICTED: polyadenylate-binding protein-interacting protein 1 [Ceratosolen solmsi marchali]|uniref:Polyadenylate-binding protein-interacting protein 1 n=1 Tax=Ceratosolen solmsi marchali TaxID=326594 RepID=A0AAJ6VLE2_9HYME|nr:PREDICTED: polyadenylate-binding protein-interacting protein 1 [Ceratosolen solmsi marchali]
MEHYGNAEASGNGEAETERWMSKGRGRGVRSVEQELLRRPHQALGTVSDIVKNSILSVDAAEFVPKAFVPSGPVSRSSVQDRIHIARQAQNVQQAMLQRQQQQYNWQQSGAPQHFQQQSSETGYHGLPYQQYNQYPIIHDYSQFDGGSGDFADKHQEDGQILDFNSTLMQLENAMRTLTTNPGRFDSLVAPLVDTISPYLDQPRHCEQIFNAIIQQSIDEGNFRYSGARLCTHLDTVAPAADRPTSIFKETLINQCKQKTDEQAETWRQVTKHTDEIEKKCHGLIFFLAELVTQMESAPASELGKLLIRLINTVLQNPASSSAKNICQALKLAGQTLERDSSGNRTEMEQVMRTLSDLVIQGRVDSHVGRMVNTVSELRSGNWGVISSHMPLHIENKQSSSSQVDNEAIFYGPDGKVITDEESRFLDDLAETEVGSQEFWDNDDEDDMIAEAFEEFLKFSQNNNKTNQKNVQMRNYAEH